MKTNFQMIKELDGKYTPESPGWVNETEKELITATLNLDERTNPIIRDASDILNLRNLRDMVVMFYSLKNSDETDCNKTYRNADKSSAITAVIDQKIFSLGGEV